ncbi:hypothetical protein Tco_0604543 [Tanacetum coccineum]
MVRTELGSDLELCYVELIIVIFINTSAPAKILQFSSVSTEGLGFESIFSIPSSTINLLKVGSFRRLVNKARGTEDPQDTASFFHRTRIAEFSADRSQLPPTILWTGDDGDDDDGDSSGDNTNEDEDDEDDEEEEEGHIAPANSTIAAPTSISLPPEAEVERLLAMTTPSPSPPISLSPPSAGERLARCTAPPAHSSPLLPSSGCPTQIQTLKISSTQALIDAVTPALPSPLPPPSQYKPPPFDRSMTFPSLSSSLKIGLYLSTLGFRYKVGESSTARPTRGREIDYGFVSTVDAEER